MKKTKPKVSKYNVFSHFILLLVVLQLSGCAVAGVGGAAIYAGSTAREERSAGNFLDDTVITTKIKKRFMQIGNNLLIKVAVNVREGRVLLTGTVPTEQQVTQAVKAAWEVPGVKEVINEIEADNKGLLERASDSLIETKIKTKFLLQKDIFSINYTIECNKGVVYLFGIARTEQELEKAIGIAKNISGVRKVVSHVTLREDPRRRDEL
jgi:osmotically-inducible protein OsmY